MPPGGNLKGLTDTRGFVDCVLAMHESSDLLAEVSRFNQLEAQRYRGMIRRGWSPCDAARVIAEMRRQDGGVK